MSNLLILGSGGHASVLAETALSTGLYSELAFLDDHNSGSIPYGPIIGPFSSSLCSSVIRDYPFASIALGDASLRSLWFSKLIAFGYTLPVILHPTSVVSNTATLGDGTVVFANSVVQANCVVGRCCILNTSSSIDHDCTLSDFSHICPGTHLAGNVSVGTMTCCGIGSSIIQGISIGSQVFLGAGAVVVSDLPDSVTAFGVPATIR